MKLLQENEGFSPISIVLETRGEADMVQAVRFAHFREAEQERAVDGSWRRFVAEMGNDMTPNA